ncbi:hypothetical protein BD413DRAFT_617962 [Trametes elegans]|nr:hypothetical protein BD413DRAFT_617962 [Trametes elegans]
MLARIGSKRTTRANAAAQNGAAAPHPPTTDNVPSAEQPMRTRSGRLLEPISEGVKAFRSKLAGARRGKKASIDAEPEAGPSNPAPSATTSSNVVNETPAPARKAPPKKRKTAARGRSTKAKASKVKVAPSLVPLPPSPAHTAAREPAPPAASSPISAASSSSVGPLPLVGPPAGHRLTRQSAMIFGETGAPEAEKGAQKVHTSIGKSKKPADESRAVKGKGMQPARGAFAALLKEVRAEVDLDALRRPQRFAPEKSIYDDERYKPQYTLVFQPPFIRQYPPEGPIVLPSVPASAPAPAPQGVQSGAQPSAPAPPPVVPTDDWNPIVFPSIPTPAEVAPEEPAARRLGTPLTRQYAEFFDEEGFRLPTRGEAGEPLLPIGEIAANILKAKCEGPYPPTWRGPFFEPSPEEGPSLSHPAPLRGHTTVILNPHDDSRNEAAHAPAPAPASTPTSTNAPQRAPLRRHNTVTYDRDGASQEQAAPAPAPASPPAPVLRPAPLRRHNAMIFGPRYDPQKEAEARARANAPTPPASPSRRPSDPPTVPAPEAPRRPQRSMPRRAPQPAAPRSAQPAAGPSSQARTDTTGRRTQFPVMIGDDPPLGSLCSKRASKPMRSFDVAIAVDKKKKQKAAEDAEEEDEVVELISVAAAKLNAQVHSDTRQAQGGAGIARARAPTAEGTAADRKGKKRARSPEVIDISSDEDEEETYDDDEELLAMQPEVQRLRTIGVRRYSRTEALLQIKVSMVPLPVGGIFREGECGQVWVFPEGKDSAAPAPAPTTKRSREEFEGEGGASEPGDADERPAKKPRAEEQ